MPRQPFERIQIPGARTRRFPDRLLTREWGCLSETLCSLAEGRREFREDQSLPDGGYYLEACAFTIWFTAPVLSETAAVTQVRYLPDFPE